MAKRPPDITHLVVVAAQPAPLRRLSDIDRAPDEIDQILDDVLGETDNRGPGLTDAVLVGGGSAAVVASQLASVPGGVLVAGIVAIGIGAILPIRSLVRRASSSRRTRTIARAVDGGQVLTTNDPLLHDLAQAHDALWTASAPLRAPDQLRIRSVGHALVDEVATLLDGRLPELATEATYVEQRLSILQDLVTAAEGTPSAFENQAQVRARLEVEATAGQSALSDATELLTDLMGDA